MLNKSTVVFFILFVSLVFGGCGGRKAGDNKVKNKAIELVRDELKSSSTVKFGQSFITKKDESGQIHKYLVIVPVESLNFSGTLERTYYLVAIKYDSNKKSWVSIPFIQRFPFPPKVGEVEFIWSSIF